MSLESVTRLAELTGRDRTTIKDRLRDIEPVPKGKALLYESKNVLPLIYDLGQKDTPMQAQVRLNNLKSDKIEFDLDKDKGLTGDISMLEVALVNVAKLINSVLDSLPLRLKKRTPKLNAKDIEYIRRVIVKLQNEISEIQLK